MKKKNIFIISTLLMISWLITNNNFTMNKNEKVEIKTYIDGKLATGLPSSTDGYKVSNITCTNGATGAFNYSTWSLVASNINSNTTCVVSFVSNNNTEFATYLKNKVCTITPTTDADAKDCLVNENGYRYEGSDPNNYIIFNDELWRIIGVLNVQNSTGTAQELVKLVRNDILDGLAWDSTNVNDWSTASLQKALNTGYLNKEDISCNAYSTYITKTCKFSALGINSTARNMIENINWNLGSMSSTSTDENYNQTTVDKYYIYERESIVASDRTASWMGKIALMYPSDYGYSVLASSCSRTTKLNNYNTTACAGNSWLYKDGHQETLTTLNLFATNNTTLFIITKDGYVGGTTVAAAHSVRPSIHLKSNVKYMSGTGTYEDPYIISL